MATAPLISSVYRNSTDQAIPKTRRQLVSELMTQVHKISPELSDYHVAGMTDEEITRRMWMYVRNRDQRVLAAVRLLTRIRQQDPELWNLIREFAGGLELE